MFAGINMFLALLKLILALAALGVKWVWVGQKHIYARDHQLYCYININYN